MILHLLALFFATTSWTKWGVIRMSFSDEYLSGFSVEELLHLRSLHRYKCEFTEADTIKGYLFAQKGIVIEDKVRSNVTLWRQGKGEDEYIFASERASKGDVMKKVNVFDLAKLAFEKSASESELEYAEVEQLANDTLIAIDEGYADLHGRRYADLALLFALAGSRNTYLFDRLATLFRDYLLAQKSPAILQTRWVRHSLERFRSAGIPPDHSLFISTAYIFKDSFKLRGDESFVFPSRSLLWLARQTRKWRKSGRQSLTNRQKFDTNDGLNISSLFRDPHLPLVIDLGCGLGVSLLGMTALSYSHAFNRLGCDLSVRSIRFATAMADRWNITSHCAFVETEALVLLQRIQSSYPGRIAWVSINFPSPYNIGELVDTLESVGNKQLPNLENFMITNSLLIKAIELLQMSSSRFQDHDSHLYFQTNVEDVGIVVQDMINGLLPEYPISYTPSEETFGNCFASSLVNNRHPFREIDKHGYSANLPLWVESALLLEINSTESAYGKRRRIWIDSGSARRRACGQNWLSMSALPPCCKTETELTCEENFKFVHRLLYTFRQN
jgi:SAM-dependent methyltransferase